MHAVKQSYTDDGGFLIESHRWMRLHPDDHSSQWPIIQHTICACDPDGVTVIKQVLVGGGLDSAWTL